MATFYEQSLSPVGQNCVDLRATLSIFHPDLSFIEIYIIRLDWIIIMNLAYCISLFTIEDIAYNLNIS